MQRAPGDLVLIHADDLSPSEFDDGFATRSDIGLFSVYSLNEAGASSVEELCNSIRIQKYACDHAYLGELATIGHPDKRDIYGRVLPQCIKSLLSDAENGVTGSLLTQTNFEGVFICGFGLGD